MIEEDYRVKNAREGKAIYVPGKAGRVAAANPAAKATMMQDATLRLPQERCEAFETALGEAGYAMSHAQDILTLLYDLLDRPEIPMGVRSMLYMCKIGFETFANREAALLFDLENQLRNARAAAQEGATK
jgi:hypothetical protein